MVQTRFYHRCIIKDELGTKKIYAVGGYYQTSIETMELSNSEWKLSAAKLPIPLFAYQIVASNSLNYLFFLIGGDKRNDPQSQILGLEKSNQEWKEVGNLQTKRYRHTTVKPFISNPYSKDGCFTT